MFRLLDDRAKEDIFDYVNMKYEKATGEKGSIYSTYTDEEKGLKKTAEDDRDDRSALA